MKSNFSIRVNLSRLTGAFVRNLKGSTATKKCLIIPIDDSPCLYHGKKGVYLNTIAFELEEKKYDDTHIVKGGINKEQREKMTDEERRNQPILGSMRPWIPEEKAAPAVKGSLATDAFEEEDGVPF